MMASRGMDMTSLRLSMIVTLALAGCGDGGTGEMDSGPPVTDAGGGGSDAGGSSDAGAGGSGPVAAACDYVDTLDDSCTTDADCAVGLHQTDCCGNSVMIGFNTSAQMEYATNESACMMSYPGCGCPAMLPTTDSGETVTDTMEVQAACVARGPTQVCLTYVTMRPDDAPG